MREIKWTKTAVTLLIGAFLGIAVQNLGERWSRPAEAASIDEIARNTMSTLLSVVPVPGGEKIKGVAGLGDGVTFIVYSEKNIRFYQFVNPMRARMSP